MRLRRIPTLATLMLMSLLVSACQPRAAPPATGAIVSRTLEHEGRTQRYAVFVPGAARAGRPLPVVLFLHGSGERGDDGHAQTTAGLGPWLRRHSDTFPALVVMPQVPDDEEWAGANARMALAALDAASSEFGADRSRTYLTGMSMGGWARSLLLVQSTRALPAALAVRARMFSARYRGTGKH